MVQRDKAEAALAAAADQALAGADRERAHHRRAVADADRVLAEVREAAGDAAAALAVARETLGDADMPDGALPGEVRVLETNPPPARVLVRTGRHDDPEPMNRPAAALAKLLPADPAAAQQGAAAAAAGAGERAAAAERRRAEARRLAQAQQTVLRAEADAEQLRSAADRDARTAAEQAVDRDAAAVQLAQAWRAWTGDAGTTELLGDIDWPAHPPIGPLILDAEALAGEVEGELSGLDRAAAEAARPAQRRIEAERARLDAVAEASRERERTLRSERADLDAKRDPKPGDPPWLDPERPGEPLWRCVEFTADLTGAGQEVQAGVEGALLASGLLTAVIQPDGVVVAADGEVLLSPAAVRPRRALSAALRPDLAAALPVDVIAGVLAGVGFDDPDAATSVSADGSWRNGPMRGRHVADLARHIGAAARAAHRRERIAQRQVPP